MNTILITKDQALSAYGGNGAALAKALGVTRQAVSAMPDGPIAERYALKLYFVLKPDFFRALVAANDDTGPAEGDPVPHPAAAQENS